MAVRRKIFAPYVACIQRNWRLHVEKRANHAHRFSKVSPSCSLEEYVKNVHVQSVAANLDELLCVHVAKDHKVDGKFLYLCFYFTRKCRYEDIKTHRIAVLAQAVIRNLMPCLRSFCAKVLPSKKVLLQLAKAVTEFYNFYPEWLQFQNRLSENLLRCVEYFAKTRKIFENSADLYDPEHPNAICLGQGADKIFKMQQTIHRLIPLQEFKTRALEIEGIINRTYREAEERTDDVISVDDDIENFAEVTRQAQNAVTGRCCLYKFVKGFVDTIAM